MIFRFYPDYPNLIYNYLVWKYKSIELQFSKTPNNKSKYYVNSELEEIKFGVTKFMKAELDEITI